MPFWPFCLAQIARNSGANPTPIRRMPSRNSFPSWYASITLKVDFCYQMLSGSHNIIILRNVTYSLWLKVNKYRSLTMDIKSKIGRRIREIREQKSVSQKDLSFSSDLDRSYIASVESGHRNISIVNLEKIAIALKVTLNELFQGL